MEKTSKKQELARIRNWKISQILGIAEGNRLTHIIPDDVRKIFGESQVKELEKLLEALIVAIKSTNKVRYLCAKCVTRKHKKPSTKKRVYRCDGCGQFVAGYEPLFYREVRHEND